MRRARRIRMSLKFLALVLWSVLRQRAFALKPVAGGLSGVTVTPQGDFLPQMAGGDKTPEEEQAEAEAAEERAQQEREAAEEETRKAEEEAEQGKPKWDGEVDKEKAERAVANARRAEQAAKEEARKAKEEAAKLRQAQETEQETIKRERDEKAVENEQLRSAADTALINEAIRDAAGELDVPVKKHRRLLRLVERGEITLDDERNVSGATEAVQEVLDEFPEFKPSASKPAEDEEPPENPGGAPDRKRGSKELTPEVVAKMAKEDPDRFNDLFEEGKIPKSALGGLKS